MGNTILKQVPVYLPLAKHTKLKAISKMHHVSITKLIEAEVDRLIKREYKEPEA